MQRIFHDRRGRPLMRARIHAHSEWQTLILALMSYGNDLWPVEILISNCEVVRQLVRRAVPEVGIASAVGDNPGDLPRTVQRHGSGNPRSARESAHIDAAIVERE